MDAQKYFDYAIDSAMADCEADIQSGAVKPEILDNLKRLISSGAHATPAGRPPVDEPVKVSSVATRRASALAKLYARMASLPTGGPDHHQRLVARISPSVPAIRAEMGERPFVADLPGWCERAWCDAWAAKTPKSAAENVAANVRARLNGGGTPVVIFPFAGSEPHWTVPRTSVPGRGARVIADLCRNYPWRPAEVTAWLICPDAPVPNVPVAVVRHRVDGLAELVPGVRAFTDTRWRISLEVDPTLTPAEVARVYAKARSHITPRRQRVRPMADRSVVLASFVLDQDNDADTASGDTWDTWLKAWNRGPGRRWGNYDPSSYERWNFRRDAKSALEHLRYAGWQVTD